jgi:lipoic acid synthetase
MKERVVSSPAKPAWIRVRLPHGPVVERVRGLLRGRSLHTVCEEALCPNRGECWGSGTATFLIMGEKCTRNCAFCAVQSGEPEPLDPDEASRAAETVKALNLTHVVITSVTRDDLPDGGATAFAQVIEKVRREVPGCTVEVLVPDFRGDEDALRQVLKGGPEVLAHNLETVKSLYARVRPKAVYERSLSLLKRAKYWAPEVVTKSGIMVGLGESWGEILDVIRDLRFAGCDILTVGQYLRPTRAQLPVARYIEPEVFEAIAHAAREAGFRWVEAGPFVRSSYHAETAFRNLQTPLPHP